MKKMSTAFKISSVFVLCLLLFSCSPVEKGTNSGSFIVVESIVGKDLQGNDSSIVFSDVITNDLYYPDFVTVTLKAATMDPNPILGVSQYSDIMLTRCVISYTRSDGATGEGTEVPYHYEVNLSYRLPVGTSVSFPLMIVRDVAKTQPPLNALVGDPTAMLECTAKIEFFGHDLRNRDVKQTAYISVRFADYVDSK
ncbi:MAG: hypothetical protein ACPLRA_02505 [Candidatus Saccharicenans sp.]